MKYYLSGVLGFSIWGTFALVLKPLSSFSAFDILMHRIIFATFCIVFACFLFRRKQTLASIQYLKTTSKQERRKLAINVFTSAIMLVSVNATSLAYLICPIITTVLASIFLNEKLNKLQWFSVLLSLTSCLILAYGHFTDLFYSMVIALTYAIYLVLQKKNTFPIDKFLGLTIHIVVSCILLLPILTVIDTNVPKTNTFYGLIVIIAVGYTIIPLFLNIYSLKGLDSSIVGTLLYLNPIISFLLAVFYYNEPITAPQIVAFSMIFLAVVIFNIAYLYTQKAKNVLQNENAHPKFHKHL
jgi:chloramphenicol-sensitive protein RarD